MSGKVLQLKDNGKALDRDTIRERVRRELAAGESERYERTAEHLEKIAHEIRARHANTLVLAEAGRLIRLRAKATG